ncbi:MAG: hypothetical protein C0483_01665 [Pirellula sp.]|nr:hypothetical protein [Pirellula sp.]
MVTMTTYGTWLRGDRRGWIDDGKLMPADPELEAADRRRMKFAPYYLPRERLLELGDALGRGLLQELRLPIYALTMRSCHVHVVVAAVRVPIAEVAKCAKDKVRYALGAERPIWGGDYDKRFCFDLPSLRNRIRYVERHNEEDGLPARPWEFVTVPRGLGE